ncbi:hypothetical protein HYW67_00180 [Candidatus Parcubacteria bacterium]|nr:hypothetical protein [Candidatus Parcubacteria bacterium]
MLQTIREFLRIIVVGLTVFVVGLVAKSSVSKPHSPADSCGESGLLPVASAQINDPSCWAPPAEPCPGCGGNADGGCGNVGGEVGGC